MQKQRETIAFTTRSPLHGCGELTNLGKGDLCGMEEKSLNII